MNEHFPTGAIQSWKRRVEAHHAQSLRVMSEERRAGDFWQPHAAGFRADPRRTDDEALNAIAELTPDGSTLLDVGGGAGRFAVALASRCSVATVVDPSPAMLEQLREAASDAGRDNVRAIHAEWQDAQVEPADIVLCSHVVYGIADIEPFLTKLTDHAHRRVIMLSFIRSPQSWLAPLWKPVHGEIRIDLPGLPELVNVLWEMDIYPNVQMLTPSPPQTFDSVESALENLTGRLWADDPAARRRLGDCIEEYLEPVDGGYRIRGVPPVRQGMVWWDV